MPMSFSLGASSLEQTGSIKSPLNLHLVSHIPSPFSSTPTFKELNLPHLPFFDHTTQQTLNMKTSAILALALVSLANSSPFPCTNSTCCFGLTASGGQSGTVGQLDDGQTRIGGGLPPAQFCMTGSSIKDSTGRGCIVTGKLTSSV